jgi:hypothetical protein
MLEEEERLGSIIFMLIYVIPFLVVIVGAKHNSDNLSCCQAKERMHACIVRRAEKLAESYCNSCSSARHITFATRENLHIPRAIHTYILVQNIRNKNH